MLRYNLSEPEDFYRLLVAGSAEHIKSLAEELTVHKTEFFREKHHFDFLAGSAHSLPKLTRQIQQSGELKAWSAGCSTGEEAYTLAMVLKESLPPHVLLRVLATDISRRVIAQAQYGSYPLSVINDIPPNLLTTYFTRSQAAIKANTVLKELVSFRTFNLMAHFPFKGKFDIIFCRNVMIYFEAPTQEKLVNKFYEALAPGGYLFIGHSESLSNLNTQFKFIKPTIYKKVGM